MNQRRSLGDWLVATAASILFVAVALTVAVNMLQAIWPALLIIGLVVAGISGLIAFLRYRGRGW